MTIEIRDVLAESDWPAMHAFLARAYRPTYIMCDRALFDWQFGFGAAPGTRTVLTAWNADRLIGMLGYIPNECHWDDPGRPVRAAWMANWMVDSAFRTGIGALLMRRLQEMFPLLLGQGANEVNKPIARRLGFTIVDRIPRRIAVFDVVRTRAFEAGGDLPMPAAWKHPGGNERARSFDAADLLHFAPRWERYGSMRFGTRRGAEYLRWRYVEHPYFDYRASIAGSDDAPALCVYRVEPTSEPGSGPVGRIVELLHADGAEGAAAGRAVLTQALVHLAEAGCAFADLYCGAEAFMRTAAECGMQDATAMPLASRLTPVDRRWHPQNLEFWAAPSLPTPGSGAFYVTKADGDQDRPNRA